MFSGTRQNSQEENCGSLSDGRPFLTNISPVLGKTVMCEMRMKNSYMISMISFMAKRRYVRAMKALVACRVSNVRG